MTVSFYTASFRQFAPHLLVGVKLQSSAYPLFNPQRSSCGFACWLYRGAKNSP
jgi:hypothetical protein